MSSSSAALKLTTMMQGTLSFHHPILHPSPAIAFAPNNRISFLHASASNYKPLSTAAQAPSVQPVTSTTTEKSLMADLLDILAEDKRGNQRDVDCRFLEEQRYHSDHDNGIREPRFNSLIRGDPEREPHVDEDEPGLIDKDFEDMSGAIDDDDDLVERNSEYRSGFDDDDDEEEDLKPKPEPSLDDLLELFAWSHSNQGRPL